MRIAKAAAIAVGAVAGALLILVGLIARQAGADYAGSPVCPGTSGLNCRVLEPATVLSVGVEGQPRRLLIAVRTSGGSRLTAQLSPGYLSSRLPSSGDGTEIEVWRGEVTRVELPPPRGLVRTYADLSDPAPIFIGAAVLAVCAGAAVVGGLNRTKLAA